jgi:hypothetical protein
MAQTKEFTKEQQQAIKLVLDMGFRILNNSGDIISEGVSEYTIVTDRGKEREFSDLPTALTEFVKQN